MNGVLWFMSRKFMSRSEVSTSAFEIFKEAVGTEPFALELRHSVALVLYVGIDSKTWAWGC